MAVPPTRSVAHDRCRRGDDVQRVAPASGVRRRARAGGRRAHRPPARIESALRVDRPSAPVVVQVGGPGVVDPGHDVAIVCAIDELEDLAAQRARRGRRVGDMPRSVRWRRSRSRWPPTSRSPNPELRTSSPRRCSRTSSWSWRPRCPCAISRVRGAARRAPMQPGRNGIDGVVSTALGRALTGTPTVVLVGDIAFVHDSNALVASPRPVSRPADRGRRQRWRWHLLVPPPSVGAPADRSRPCSAHRTAPTSKASPTPTESLPPTITDAGELAGRLTQPGPWLIRVPTNRADNVVVHDRLNAAVAAALGARPRPLFGGIRGG